MFFDDLKNKSNSVIGFSNPTFQSFPNFCNVWTSAFLSDTSIRPTSKPRPKAGFAIQAQISGKKQAGIWLGYHWFQQQHTSNL